MLVDVTVSTTIKASAEVVFEWLIDLDRYPLWNASLREVGRGGRMHEGMIVPMKSLVMGKPVESSMEVVRLVPGKDIELLNNTGAVPYRAVYRFIPEGAQTEIVLWCQIEPQSRVFQLARPLIESLAKARLSGDLASLKALIEAEA
jgi:hypothetical protein